ncbi:hypothetical protein L1987_18122 [Smallanthus sonchifolius]|uniref:Uncharacterized protein n=1 Tax=Smallanthus sonchifolius TaxID=185202 RepID=A0ACB9J0W5_9ASTR|nr:hypothetical protein L1987_18122 [Smallanthus sonchifolius]
MDIPLCVCEARDPEENIDKENASPDRIIPLLYPRSTAISFGNHDVKSNSSMRAAAAIIEKKDKFTKLEAIYYGKPLDEVAWDMDDVVGCFEINADLAEALDAKQNESIDLPMDTFKCHNNHHYVSQNLFSSPMIPTKSLREYDQNCKCSATLNN